MTAAGELFVDEELRDEVQKLVESGDSKFAFLSDKNWKLDGSDFADIWDMGEFPNTVTVPVLDSGTDEMIAKIRAGTRRDDTEVYEIDVEWNPQSIELKRLKE